MSEKAAPLRWLMKSCVPENDCILRHYAIHGDNATSLREILRISELAKAAESCDPLEARKPYPL